MWRVSFLILVSSFGWILTEAIHKQATLNNRVNVGGKTFQSTVNLVMFVRAHRVWIKIPIDSNHSCDLLYVRKNGPGPYNEACYEDNECRYVYTGNGLSYGCIPLSKRDIKVGLFVEIPNTESLKNGTYVALFARWGSWSTPVKVGNKFQITNSTVNLAGANGDPHVTNIDGQKFDILRTGTHTLVHMPRDASTNKTMLFITALVRRFLPNNTSVANRCWDTWITNIFVRGSWLENVPSMEFFTAPGPFNSPATIKMKVGNGSATSPDEARKSIPSYTMEVITPERTPVAPKRRHQKTITKTVLLHLGPVLVNITWAQTLAKMGYTNHLDIETKHLKYAMVDVGGILGKGDHSWASTKPEECMKRAKRAVDLEDLSARQSTVRASME